jgi:hypothetical protein
VLGLGRKEKTEVFFVKSLDELPLEEIKFIREKYPNDNIIITCPSNLTFQLHGFKTVKFPGVTLKEMKQMIQVYYHRTSRQADKIISDHYNSIEMIFDYFKRKSKI